MIEFREPVAQREVIDSQGYIITPLLMSRTYPDCNGGLVYGPADPEAFPQEYKLFFLGRFEPTIVDPFTKQEAVFGRFLVYRPDMIYVHSTSPLNEIEEERLIARQQLWIQERVKEGKTILDTDRPDRTIVAICRK